MDKDLRANPQLVFTASHGKNVFLHFLPAKNHERIGRINADFMDLVGGKVDVRILLGNASCGLDYCCKYSLLDKQGNKQFTEQTSPEAVVERMRTIEERAEHRWIGSHEEEGIQRKMLWSFTSETVRACANREGTSAQMVVSEILRSTGRQSESLVGNSTHVRTSDWVKAEPVRFNVDGIEYANRRCSEKTAAELSDFNSPVSVSGQTAFLYLNRKSKHAAFTTTLRRMENNSAEDSSGPSGAVTGESAKKSQQELLRTVPRMSLFDFVSSFDVLPPTDGSNQLWKWLGRTQKGVVKKQLCYRSERFGVQRQEKQEVV